MQAGMLFLNFVPEMRHDPPDPLLTIFERIQHGFQSIKSSISDRISREPEFSSPSAPLTGLKQGSTMTRQWTQNL
jgi:hypothetical protein